MFRAVDAPKLTIYQDILCRLFFEVKIHLNRKAIFVESVEKK